jgi:hypothetical protein
MGERLFNDLARHYRQAGYSVYSRYAETLGVPSDWRGPEPDMVIEKGKLRTAIYRVQGGGDASAVAVWRRTTDESGASLRLLVDSRAEAAAVRELLRGEQLEADIAVLQRVAVRRRRPWLRWSRRGLLWKSGALAAAVLLAALLVWSIAVLFDYDAAFYTPHDAEREAQQQKSPESAR